MIRLRSLLSIALLLSFSAIGRADESIIPVSAYSPFADQCGVTTDPSCALPATCSPPLSNNCCPSGPNCASTSGCGATGCGDSSKLLGIFAHSDGFTDFISPMTNPVYFETPRTVTEAHAIFVNHAVPSSLGGGNVQLFALQARAALTENLSIIATKDGFFVSQNPIVKDGFADVNAGLKYNLYKNYATQTLLSTGFTYGIPLGSQRALQGKGNGELNFFLSGGQQLGTNWHVLSTFGARIPANNASYSESTYFSNHLDRKIGNTGFYAFTEANWYHWLSNGNQFAANVEGVDLFNLGSTSVLGNDIVTGAYGIKYKPNDHLEVGLCYEIPYTSRRDILQNRLTADLIIRF